MLTRSHLILPLLALLTLIGCGGSGADGKPSVRKMAGTEHDKLMGEAMDLSLKILNEVQGGKDYKEVDKAYAEQVAAMNAQIAKLPPLSVDQTNELLHMIHGTKEREIEKKQSEIALKGGLPKLPDYWMYDVESMKASK